MTISEKVAYLKGFAEGVQLENDSSNSAKLISIMIGILEEVGLSIEDLEENALALGEEIDALSDEISQVDQCCDHHHDYHEDFDEEFELDCPSCTEAFLLTEDMFESGQLYCPHCEAHFVIDLTDEEHPFHRVDNQEENTQS